ncbi:MAG: hypothetical protein LUE86_14220 [Clostridiales bacterium]|nr:hypothetical protein [Clostridiales bacterium]
MKGNKLIKLVVLNLCIVASAVISYSPGLLNLRPGDSLLRAGASIIIGIMLAMAFLAGNLLILYDPQKSWITENEITGLSDAQAVLKGYFGGRHFGSLAKTAYNQADRLERVSAKSRQIILSRFGKGSMSAERYLSVTEAAKDTLVQNVTGMANRMQMFDEKEYTQLVHYKEDDIPDDIQEQQIALYQENEKHIRNAISANEKLLLEIEKLSMELAGSNTNMESDELLSEIQKLSDEVKLYR